MAFFNTIGRKETVRHGAVDREKQTAFDRVRE